MFKSCVNEANEISLRLSTLEKGHTLGAKGHASKARTIRAQSERVKCFTIKRMSTRCSGGSFLSVSLSRSTSAPAASELIALRNGVDFRTNSRRRT